MSSNIGVNNHSVAVQQASHEPSAVLASSEFSLQERVDTIVLKWQTQLQDKLSPVMHIAEEASKEFKELEDAYTAQGMSSTPVQEARVQFKALLVQVFDQLSQPAIKQRPIAKEEPSVRVIRPAVRGMRVRKSPHDLKDTRRLFMSLPCKR